MPCNSPVTALTSNLTAQCDSTALQSSDARQNPGTLAVSGLRCHWADLTLWL
ncbi:MAG TPA: hypothetical protein V6C85_15475 [Allocoleopsis sp.]